MKNTSHEATVDIGPLENVRVRFDFQPGRPGCMYLRNGDPGYPDEPEELWITEVFLSDKWIDAALFDTETLGKVEIKLLEDRGDALAADAAGDAWEARQERQEEQGYP